MSVLVALEADLAELAKRDKDLAAGALAATAKQLGAELDSPDNSATSKSMCARALMEIVAKLEELAPVEKEDDRVDELGRKRAARRSAAASD